MAANYTRVTVTVQQFPMSNALTVLNSIDQMTSTIATIDISDQTDSASAIATKIQSAIQAEFKVVATHPLEEVRKPSDVKDK